MEVRRDESLSEGTGVRVYVGIKSDDKGFQDVGITD